MASPSWLGTTSTNWDVDANWTPGTKPADTDTAIFNYLAQARVAGSDQSTIELAALRIDSTYTYTFGDNGTPLIVDATLVDIGLPSGSSTAGTHSGRINLKLPDVASTITVHGTKTSSEDTGKEPVRIWTGANANKLYVKGSSRVGIATDLVTNTAQFSEIACLSTQAYVNVASGTTLTKWRQTAGTGNLYCAMTTLQQDGGIVSTFGSGAITTANVRGVANLNSTGTITALNVQSGGHANLLDTAAARTVTTITLVKGAKLSFDPNVITVTNPIVLSQCNIEDVTINTPSGLTVAVVKT